MGCCIGGRKEKQLPKLLFVGLTGVGKTTLFKRLDGKKANGKETLKFKEFTVKNEKQYVVVDTPSFEMDGSIDQREKTISLFQEYFEHNLKWITTFAIVVNFERTELMKKKISDVYKYFRKFASNIYIVVVNMELSENEKGDEEQLRNNFSVYNPVDILFLSKNLTKNELIQKIIQIVKPLSQPLDFTDTIFEKIDSKILYIDVEKLRNNIQPQRIRQAN